MNWETSLEMNNRGFNIYRTFTNDRKPTAGERLNQALIRGERTYRYVDKTTTQDCNHYYWLEDVDIFGYKTLHGPVYANKNYGLPKIYELSQNYPNPFNPETVIKYSLPQADRVEITIYNVMGQLIRTLVDNTQKAGYHTVLWDGRNELGVSVSSGIYFVKMNANSFVQTRKMMMLR